LEGAAGHEKEGARRSFLKIGTIVRGKGAVVFDDFTYKALD